MGDSARFRMKNGGNNVILYISKSLYLLCMVRDRKIRSLRDLRGKHVKLLENLLKQSMEVIKEVENICALPPQYIHIYSIDFVQFCNIVSVI